MMRSLRWLLPTLATLLAAIAVGQPKELVWRVAESQIATTVYERHADGTFRSETHLSVATQKIDSVLTGRFVDGKLVEFRLEQEAGPQKAVLTGADGKTRVTVNDKTTEGKFTPPSAVFSNYHPWILSTAIGQFNPDGPPSQKVSTFLPEALAEMPFEIVRLATKSIEVGGKAEVIDAYRVKLPNVEIDVFLNPKKEVVGWLVPTQRLDVGAKGYEALFVDPTTKMPELSQPTFTAKVERGVKIPVRDGVELAADMARPTAEGKYPAILVRSPYGRAASAIEAEWWAKRGYVFIAQDVRGRGDSKGDWNPFMPERADGFDTIEWISKQPWSDGKVGMIGGSYLGMVQWQAAVEKPPALKCIVPQVSPPDMFYNIPWDHGIPFLFGSIWWARVVQGQEGVGGAFAPVTHFSGLLSLPITKADDAVLGYDVPFVDDWWTRTTNKAFAPGNFQSDLKNVDIPALMISGWWDGDGIGTKTNWERMRALHKPNQYLIYGPWTHLFNTTSSMGDVDYGPGAILELNSVYLRWFDRWLKDKPVLDALPKVKIFVTGDNEWRTFADWPPKEAPETTLYFAADGLLSEQKQGMPKPTTYTYDPSDFKLQDTLEIGTGGGSTVLEARTKDDYALFKTEPLKEETLVGGPLSVDLYFKTDVVDTDFFAMLVDFDEKGVMRLVGMPGKLRAQYRHNMDRPELLEPGHLYSLTLDLWDTAHAFKPGHRIGVIVTSAMFPNYARNLNTGEPVTTGTRMVTAHQTIFHDVARPSALRFHELPKS
ncbi:MAG: CocE/NonD family hydrolase [Fimbriimonadaceae bacterium]|nr:CocE/NonD family hydrolase [Fimbriimonadaceae bacterium]